MNFLTLEQIKETDEILIEDVFVPEWKGYIKMKGLSSEEIGKIVEQAKELNPVSKQMQVNDETAKYLRVIYSIMEPDLSAKDVLWLKNKSYITINRLLQFSDYLSMGISVKDLNFEEVPENAENKEETKDEK